MSIETMQHGTNSDAWAQCNRRTCGWQGPIRANYWDARNDETEHDRVAHPKSR